MQCIHTPFLPLLVLVPEFELQKRFYSFSNLNISKMNELKMLEQLDRIEKLVRAQKAVLTFDQACDYTGLSRSYMYKLTARGEIPFSKPRGKLIFLSREKLDNWLLNNSHSSKDEIKRGAVEYTFRNKRF